MIIRNCWTRTCPLCDHDSREYQIWKWICHRRWVDPSCQGCQCSHIHYFTSKWLWYPSWWKGNSGLCPFTISSHFFISSTIHPPETKFSKSCTFFVVIRRTKAKNCNRSCTCQKSQDPLAGNYSSFFLFPFSFFLFPFSYFLFPSLFLFSILNSNSNSGWSNFCIG